MFKRSINYGVILLGVTSMPYLASSTSQINRFISTSRPVSDAGRSASNLAQASDDPLGPRTPLSRSARVPAQPAGNVQPARRSGDDLLEPRAEAEDSLSTGDGQHVSVAARSNGFPSNEKSGTSATAVANETAATPVSTAATAVSSPSTAAAAAAIIKDGKEMPPVVEMAEALRYDVTTQWVLARYPRVTTGSIEGDLHGYRVPLVTGTRQDDVTGALTYYFNKRQVVEKITLQGNCGDPRKLVLLLTSRFQFVRQPTDDPGLFLYQTRWNGKARGELQVRPAKIVHATTPYARYLVTLTMANSSAR